MKQIALGTAMWGWTVDKQICFKLLDRFYKNGGRYIDTASNYPIIGLPEKRYFAEKTICEWINTNQISDLSVIYKTGSVSNANIPDNDLSDIFLQKEYERVIAGIKNNLKVFMIHWDNRDNIEEISKTLELMTKMCGENIGFSGIKNPESYVNAMSNLNYSGSYYLEIKSNIYQSSIKHFQPLVSSKSKIFAYGISVSGLKINAEEYHANSYVTVSKPQTYHNSIMTDIFKNKMNKIMESDSSIKSLYHIGILFSEADTNLYGYIVAPSNEKQVEDIFAFRKNVPELLEKIIF